MQTSNARGLFERLGSRAGLPEGKSHAHGLRHAFAVEMAQAGKRPELIQRQLGHSNLGTTTKYLSTIAPEEVIDAMWDF